MKILIFTVDHVYSNYVIKKLFFAYPDYKFYVIESGVLLAKKTLFRSVLRYLSVSGWYYVLFQIIKLLIYKVFTKLLPLISNNKESKFYPYKSLAIEKNIDPQKVKDVGSIEQVDKIKKIQPDLIISVFFNQILKNDLISIPKYGVINIHPSYLPDYKGISPTFWALANGENSLGVSVHFINEGIDTGQVIYRKKIMIADYDSEDSIYWKCTKEGAELLIRTVKEIKNSRKKLLVNKNGRYFSLPTREAVEKFRRNKRAFFRLKEYIFEND